MLTPKYLASTAPNNIDFAAPVFPGSPLSEQLPSWQLISKFTNEDLHQWREYNNVTKALQKQILNAVESDFIAHLNNKFSSYNDVKINKLLDFLLEK
jgi:hypothetical protein